MATTPTARYSSPGAHDDIDAATAPAPAPTPTLPSDDRTPTVELPEPLQGSDDETSENVGPANPGHMAVNLNQSIFGLIAAAGSRVDFNTRFDDGSSDEEEGSGLKPLRTRHRDLSQTAILGPLPPKDKRLGKKQPSGHRMLKSFASLPKRSSRSAKGSSRLWEPTQEVDEHSETSGSPSPQISLQQPDDDLRIAPVMSRMLEAKAEMASRSSFDTERDSSGPERTDEGERAGDEEEEGEEEEQEEDEDDEENEDDEEHSEGEHVTELAKKLMQIFNFDEPERVIEGTFALAYTTMLKSQLTDCHVQSIPAGSCRVSCSKASYTSLLSTFASTHTFRRRR